MSEQSKIFEKRMIFAGVAMIIASVMTVGGYVDAANFERILVWITGIFVLGDASADWAKYLMTGQGTATKSAEVAVK